jgi:hypothetical protein
MRYYGGIMTIFYYNRYIWWQISKQMVTFGLTGPLKLVSKGVDEMLDL